MKGGGSGRRIQRFGLGLLSIFEDRCGGVGVLRWLFPGMTKRNEKEISNIEVSTTVPLGYLVDGGAFVKRMKERRSHILNYEAGIRRLIKREGCSFHEGEMACLEYNFYCDSPEFIPKFRKLLGFRAVMMALAVRVLIRTRIQSCVETNLTKSVNVDGKGAPAARLRLKKDAVEA
ncbi:uncharacterized protein RSE6_12742 [Rhynchosporium secalis]|uniref:Uncharacterized protein n=1 Tax=Rhynchosporium secalis TaxID=38038 RepID=A0A1E1MR90_RHYSE|nr:uncharacterized protein RSE6_12742 [Rhynchosporium secalis]